MFMEVEIFVEMGSKIVIQTKKELSDDNSFLAPFAGLEPATL